MEHSSTHSSDQTHVESHPLEPIASHHTQSSSQHRHTGKFRVRFNSSAAEIPPRETNCLTRASASDNDQNSDDAETTRALHPKVDDLESDQTYAVTGNAQGGVLYQLLQAYKPPVPAPTATPSEGSGATPATRPGSSSGAVTPSRRKWYKAEKASQSQETLATLIGASAKLANPNEKKETNPHQRHHKRTSSAGVLSKVWKPKEEQDARIKIHVANILKRQRYIIKMCRALMLFGAPTHRLEEYMTTTAKVLEIDSQFLYIPGCMIVSFDDVLSR